MATGVVKWFNPEKGFGFITPDDGSQDVFTEFTAINATGYRTLHENDRVEFETESCAHGLQARKVTVLP